MDLSKLKIEDLEEVTEGYWANGEDMIVAADNKIMHKETVFFIKPRHEYGIVVSEDDSYSSCIFKAYKIPTPQKREMNSLEVMEYLHLLQLKLNRVEVELLHFDFVNDEFFKNRNLLQNDGFDFGVVVYSVGSNNNFGKWANSSSFWGFIGNMSYKFGILKNGKITEFEIPEIEV